MSIKHALLKSGYLIVALSLLPVGAHARMYKCVAASGEITYSQKACDSSQSSQTLSAVQQSNLNTTGCKFARDFAASIVSDMRASKDTQAVFDQHGGLNSLSKSSVNIINYVYSYVKSDEISPETISSLSQAKCNSGAFGEVSCDTLPHGFASGIKECNPEDKSEIVSESDKQDDPQMSPAQNRSRNTAPAVTTQVNTQQKNIATSANCKEGYQHQIDLINDKMRQGYSSSEGDQYREEIHNLRKMMRENCG